MLGWRTIRSLVHSKPLIAVAGVFVVVPLIAILVSWTKNATGIGSLSVWLKIAYFAAVMYIIAGVAYGIFCPELIKRYDNEIDLIHREFDPLSRSNPRYRLEITLTQLTRREPDYEALVELSKQRDVVIGTERDNVDARIDSIVELHWPDTVQRYLVRQYDECDRSRAAARFCCIGAWIIGTVASILVIGHRTVIVFTN
jgi:hypothetical protein